MILDQTTFNRVSALFKTPHNSVSYCGCWNKETVCFSFEQKDPNGLIRSGFVAHITHDFKIAKVERLKAIWGKHNGQTVTEFVPIHPAGNPTLLYKLCSK